MSSIISPRVSRILQLSRTFATAFERSPSGWSFAAGSYDEIFTPAFRVYADEALTQNKPSKGQDILDIGCGTGALALLAAERGFPITAIDFSPSMIAGLKARQAEAQLPARISPVVMNAENLKFPDSSFDRIYSLFAFMFFNDPQKGFSEVHRVLKPGGSALIASWASMKEIEWVRRNNRALLTVKPSLAQNKAPQAADSLSDKARLSEFLTTAGFSLSECSIVTVEKKIPVKNPAQFWDGLAGGFPAVREVLEQFDSSERAQVKKHFVDGMIKDGAQELSGTALFTIARKEEK